MDRNITDSYACRVGKGSLSARRAWIEIPRVRVTCCTPCRSLSARRAWIEICVAGGRQHPDTVALRKESVDRNTTTNIDYAGLCASLSARRAWIEMEGCIRSVK